MDDQKHNIGFSLAGFKDLSLQDAMNLCTNLLREFEMHYIELFSKRDPLVHLFGLGNWIKIGDFLCNFKIYGAHLLFTFLDSTS